MFLNIRIKSVDNKTMKTLWKINTFLLLFTLTACMPDSLTKFKEDPTKKVDETTSSGGSGTPTVPDSTCVIGVDPLCTSPGAIYYPEAEHEHLIAEGGSAPSTIIIEAFFPTQILEQEDFILVTAQSDFADKTGFIVLPTTGDLENNSLKFLPKTTFEMTATYSTPELLTDEVSTTNITFTQATDLESIVYPTKVGQKLIIRLDDATFFSTTAGFDYIASPSGAAAKVTFIDKQNKELHATVMSNTGNGTFRTGNEVDNSTTFFTKRAVIENVYYAFDRSEGIQTALAPAVTGFASLSPSEVRSLRYAIFPTLPAGLSFDQNHGTIGTLRGYQVLNDGPISTTAGSRTVTGTATQFLSHLQVGSSIFLNGELHKVESIVSNTEFTTYLPQSSTAISGSIKKYIKGSLSLTNGSPIITGFGTDFTTEIIPTKPLAIDPVADFTGLSALVTVNSSSALTLGANFGGTALTIPELKATDFVVSAKNILNKSVNSIIEIGLLNTVQPKSISKIQYNLTPGEKVIIPVGNASNFSTNDYISNKFGTIGRVNYIDTTNNKIFTTIFSVGNICNDPNYSTQGSCLGAGQEWIKKGFDSGDELDNASAFFTAETSASEDATRVYAVSPTTPISLKQTIVPTLLAAELDSLEYSIEPDISAGQGFCDIQVHTNEFDCVQATGNWSQGLIFATADQCTNPAFTTQATCIGPNQWIKKGEFYGLISTSFPPTKFTVTTTNLVGRTMTSDVIISVNEAPTGLSASRSVLLHVPSYYAFEIGDAISSNNGAIGTVTGKFKTTAFPPYTNLSKDTLEYHYLEVRVLDGVFSEFDDLDNIQTFTAQKTYVLGQGAYRYNTKVSAVSTNGFLDPEYLSYSKHDNLIQVGGKDRARVVFNDETRNNLYLNVYDTELTNGNEDPLTLTTNETITAINVSPVASAVITSLESNNIIFNSPIASFNSASKGYDVAMFGDTAIGMLHSHDKLTNKSYVSVSEGVFLPSTNFDDQSPFAVAVGATGQISNEAAFYFYRGDETTISFNLDASDGATVLSLDKALPPGLTTFSENGMLAGIQGSPIGPSSKEKYKLTATNSFGSTTYEFFIKVYDHITLTDLTGSSTYILHKSGKGNGRTPCRVTDDQVNSGVIGVQDITCYLDAGEDELHWNGVKVNISVGDGMCQFVRETPYAFWKFAPGESNPAPTYVNTGYQSCTINKPSADFSTDAAGTISAGISELQNLCTYDYATQRQDGELPNCDSGTPDIINKAWVSQPFECINTELGNVVTADTNPTDCVNNNMYCDGGAATGNEDEDECTALGGGANWITAGVHNSIGANGINGTDQEGTCTGIETPGSHECNGQAYNCLSGPRTTWAELANSGSYEDGDTTLNRNISTSGSATNLSSDYTSGYEAGGNLSNTFFSNYLSSCSASTYSPDVTSIQTFAAATNATASHLGSITQQHGSDHPNATRPLYTYVCTTGAGTIKARINMVVRDFDRDFKVKLGMCNNSAFTNQLDCEVTGNTWSAATGIDLHNPDQPLTTAAGGTGPGATDVRNFLVNNQLDPFNVPYNSYTEPENYQTGGACGAPVFDFDPGVPVRPFPDEYL